VTSHMRIELHIERVVLDGVAPRHVPAVREALLADLGRLVAAAPVRSWQRSRHARRIAAPPAPSAGGPIRLGAGIAASVYGGLTGGAR
jgi:hypothetical protein